LGTWECYGPGENQGLTTKRKQGSPVPTFQKKKKQKGKRGVGGENHSEPPFRKKKKITWRQCRGKKGGDRESKRHGEEVKRGGRGTRWEGWGRKKEDPANGKSRKDKLGPARGGAHNAKKTPKTGGGDQNAGRGKDLPSSGKKGENKGAKSYQEVVKKTPRWRVEGWAHLKNVESRNEDNTPKKTKKQKKKDHADNYAGSREGRGEEKKFVSRSDE